MAQLVLELAYSFFIEVLCYGTGYFILSAFGFRKFDGTITSLGQSAFYFGSWWAY